MIDRLKHLNETFTPLNKLKNIVCFYQISTKVPPVYDVVLPAEVQAFLDQFQMIVSFGMKGIATTPLECMGLEGYKNRLLSGSRYRP